MFRGTMQQLKHLNLDDAWRNEPFALPVVDARAWGPQLRFSAPPRLIAEFYREHETNLAVPFLLYGSGDFHYLTALRLRREHHLPLPRAPYRNSACVHS